MSAVAVEIQQLKFHWSADKPTLDIESWQVQQGESVLLRGASGSGKSTLLSLLAGINKPQSGTISLLGTDVSQLTARRRDRFRADHIGYIFQQFNLLPYLSAMDNVLLGIRFSKRRQQRLSDSPETTAQQLLNRLGLSQQQQQQPAAQLSVGQQQRVAAARALIGSPELLIADEPTSALDANNRDSFIQLLLELSEQRGTTVLFVTHDPALARFFDSHVELDNINRVRHEVNDV